MFDFWKKREQMKDLKEIRIFLRSHLNEFESKKEKIPEDIFETTCFLLEEIIDIYESIAVLYRQKHFRSSVVLARSVIENSISLRYIYQADSEKRALNFKLFSMREYLKRAERMEGVPPPEVKQMLEIMRKRVEEYQPSGSNPNQWDGKSVKEKTQALQSESIYDIYKHLSNYTHSKFKGSRDLSIERPYNDYIRELVFKQILVHTLQALADMCLKYDLDGGVMIMHDYPELGSAFFFATNPKRREAEMKDIKF